MGIAQLIRKKQNLIDTIVLDVILTEGATATARLTENPVEEGANVSDHYIVEPMTFYTEGIVSNISSSVVGQFTALAASLTQDLTKAQAAWDELLKLRRDRVTFTLIQGLASYENVVILSIKQDTDKNTANGLFFTATYKELAFVGSVLATEDQFSDDNTADKNMPTKDGGLKQGVT